MIGERIGNYVIRQQLGEGGMGAVYLAEHPQIGKKVALKLLHPELAARQDIVTRFFYEAKAVNDIAHPNIVDILDFGEHPSARGTIVYLVMELLAGESLTSVVARGPLELARADETSSVTIKLAGFADEKREIRFDTDGHVPVDLVKRQAGKPAPRGETIKPGPSRPVGDNTLDPFDN
jgi:hypothetical protein